MVKINTGGPFPKIRAKKSKIHGMGVFALENIKKGTTVVEYQGEKINSKEGTRRSEAHPELSYIFTLNNKWDIDGNSGGNGAQYINHSCSPNCDIDIIKQRVWIFAIKDIKKGDELFFDYWFDADELLDCRCGAKDKIGRKRCRDYMNYPESIPKLKRQLERAAKKKAKKTVSKKKKPSSKKKKSVKKKSSRK